MRYTCDICGSTDIKVTKFYDFTRLDCLECGWYDILWREHNDEEKFSY